MFLKNKMIYSDNIIIFKAYLQSLKIDYSDIAKLNVSNINLVKIYFWARGRNAWHGTWIKHFFPGESIYKTIEDVKQFSEYKRKQGNVFYIEELPALLIEFDKKIGIVISQINTHRPFSEINIKCLTNILKDSTHISWRDIFRIFSKYGCWKNLQNTRTSLIFIYVYPSTNFELLKTTPLKEYISQSFGKDYYLHWNKVKSNEQISQYYIRKIYKILQNKFLNKNI